MNRLSLMIFLRVGIMSIMAFLSTQAYGGRINKDFYVDKYGYDKHALERLSMDVNANGGGRIVFPKNAVYEIDIENDSSGGRGTLPQESSVIFSFRNCKKVLVEMNGSKIVVNKNHSTKYCVFLFYKCKSFCLNNGILVGDAKLHDYSPVEYGGEIIKSSHQWGHGVDVTGSKGLIRNMQISYMIGDGIRVSSYKSKEGIYHAKAKVDNCEISYCRRNGVTLGSTEGFFLSNSFVHHIGTHDGIIGALPQAGLDLEFEDKAGDQGYIKISNCHFSECTTSTITASNTSVPNPLGLLISDSKVEGSYFQIANVQVHNGGKKYVYKCTFVNTPINCGDAIVDSCSFEMGTKIHYVHGTSFHNCTFSGQLKESDSKYGGCFAGNAYTPASFSRCQFKDVRGKNDNSIYQGFSGYAFKLNAFFEGCVFYNCSFSQGGAGAESNYSFRDCTLTGGCTIHNRSNNLVEFNESVLDNVSSYSNQKGHFSFNHCEIIQDDNTIQFPLLYFGNLKVKGCTISDRIEITPDMKSHGVKAALIEVIE